MDYETMRLVGELLISGFAGILWWNFRGLVFEQAANKKDVSDLRTALSDLRLLMATDYVKHSDMEKLLSKIDDMSDRFDNKFEKVFDLIGQKADKS